jgi:hypothetical protein
MVSSLSCKHMILKQVRTIVNFFRHRSLRERFSNECLQGPYRGFRNLFEDFSARYIEWRWGSLLGCLQKLATLHAPLTLCWDSKAMKGASLNASSEGSRAGLTEPEFSADDDADAVGNVVYNSLFWSYIHMFLALASGVDRMLNWLQSCSCHRSRHVRKACNLIDNLDASSRLQESCPLQGLRTVRSQVCLLARHLPCLYL